MGKLNIKQKKFADEYLICSNATEAAKKAGYSEKTAYSIGQRLLKKVEVKNYIDERLKIIESEKIADTKEIMESLTRILRGEETEEVVVIEGQGDGVTEARKIKKEVSPKDKLKEITAILPGAENPSIIELEGSPDRVAMHVVSREKVFWETMEELKRLGASSILVVPIEKMLD